MDENITVRSYSDYVRPIVLLVLGIILGSEIGLFYYGENKINENNIDTAVHQLDGLYKNMRSSLNDSINDPEFVKFSNTAIESKCPFYKPDGITYRQCLSDWEEALSLKSPKDIQTKVHLSCEDFTKEYADAESLQGNELFLRCAIYRFIQS
ncbi:MAG: hypothetical protein JWN37_563 [Candidatus Nomurabacteria bacterium]|nr:hypothetical protein [Candidatus Nomurabacteria bacterium]